MLNLLYLVLFAGFFLLHKIKKTIEPYDHFHDFDQAGCDVNFKPYLKPGNAAISNLDESLTTGTSRFCGDCDCYLYHTSKKSKCKHMAPFLGTDQPCGSCEKYPKSEKVPLKLKDRIVVRQPFFLTQGADLKDYYNCAYYNDFRYPKRPIPTAFAKNPGKYCCKYPNRYPCYVRYSRPDLK